MEEKVEYHLGEVANHISELDATAHFYMWYITNNKYVYACVGVSYTVVHLRGRTQVKFIFNFQGIPPLASIVMVNCLDDMCSLSVFISYFY